MWSFIGLHFFINIIFFCSIRRSLYSYNFALFLNDTLRLLSSFIINYFIEPVTESLLDDERWRAHVHDGNNKAP